jgi:hypothetical protein
MQASLPTTMRAAVLNGYGGPDQLAVETVPVPAMMPHNEVMIEVHAAGLNPFDAWPGCSRCNSRTSWAATLPARCSPPASTSPSSRRVTACMA